jgi:hypothetical protein
MALRALAEAMIGAIYFDLGPSQPASVSSGSFYRFQPQFDSGCAEA